MTARTGSHARYDSGRRTRQTMTWSASDRRNSASPPMSAAHIYLSCSACMVLML